MSYSRNMDFLSPSLLLTTMLGLCEDIKHIGKWKKCRRKGYSGFLGVLLAAIWDFSPEEGCEHPSSHTVITSPASGRNVSTS